MRARNRKSRITATGDFRKILKKQKYFLVGEHSAVRICTWTKKSLVDGGKCYKEQFYGIKSRECCQMSPFISCANKCVHCWRPIELDIKLSDKINEPKEIIEGCIKAQRKLLSGLGGYEKTNKKKFKEAQEPSQFAISLIGEPTQYPELGELIKELRKQKKTSFLVTNGLFPEKIKELQEKNALPTQLYISMLYPNEELFRKITQNKEKDSWNKYLQTLELLKNLKTRTVIRITLVKELNMDDKIIKEYAELIKKASPLFIEVKSFMHVGFSKERLSYKQMPLHKEIKEFSEKLLEFLPEYKFLDEKTESRVVLLGKDKEKMKIKDKEV